MRMMRERCGVMAATLARPTPALPQSGHMREAGSRPIAPATRELLLVLAAAALSSQGVVDAAGPSLLPLLLVPAPLLPLLPPLPLWLRGLVASELTSRLCSICRACTAAS